MHFLNLFFLFQLTLPSDFHFQAVETSSTWNQNKNYFDIWDPAKAREASVVLEKMLNEDVETNIPKFGI